MLVWLPAYFFISKFPRLYLNVSAASGINSVITEAQLSITRFQYPIFNFRKNAHFYVLQTFTLTAVLLVLWLVCPESNSALLNYHQTEFWWWCCLKQEIEICTFNRIFEKQRQINQCPKGDHGGRGHRWKSKLLQYVQLDYFKLLYTELYTIYSEKCPMLYVWR